MQPHPVHHNNYGHTSNEARIATRINLNQNDRSRVYNLSFGGWRQTRVHNKYTTCVHRAFRALWITPTMNKRCVYFSKQTLTTHSLQPFLVHACQPHHSRSRCLLLSNNFFFILFCFDDDIHCVLCDFIENEIEEYCQTLFCCCHPLVSNNFIFSFHSIKFCLYFHTFRWSEFGISCLRLCRLQLWRKPPFIATNYQVIHYHFINN